MTNIEYPLSVQIPYTEERIEQFLKLKEEILKQFYAVKEPHTLNWDGTDKSMTIGEKREKLYQNAIGKYVWQIDSDDWIAPNAIELILEAIKNNPGVDCITFEEYVEIDGRVQRSNHSLKYNDWANNEDGYDYVRTPFMKSVIKTEIARSVPIPHIRFGEDHQWAQALKPHLKTEVHINQQLYRYIHKSSNPTERYGLNKD